jgi:hypothetical protein
MSIKKLGLVPSIKLICGPGPQVKRSKIAACGKSNNPDQLTAKLRCKNRKILYENKIFKANYRAPEGVATRDLMTPKSIPQYLGNISI